LEEKNPKLPIYYLKFIDLPPPLPDMKPPQKSVVKPSVVDAPPTESYKQLNRLMFKTWVKQAAKTRELSEWKNQKPQSM